MLPVSEGFLAALSTPQRVSVRADISKGGVRVFSGLPVLGGRIDVDWSSITRRTMELVLAPVLRSSTYHDRRTMPWGEQETIGHYGHEVSVQWGLTYPSGVTEWLPLGVFRVDEVSGSLLGDGPVTLSGVSREAFVADSRFLAPTTRSGTSAVEIITDLIREPLPGAEVLVTARQDRRVPRTTWDRDRWGAITDLAQSLGAVVYADPYGRFVIADAPTVDTPPVWRVRGGEGGVLVSADGRGSRRRVYNAVVVTGESPSSDVAPVHAVAKDDGDGSRTRWGNPGIGRFGEVPMFMYLPNVTSQEQAQMVADSNLLRHVGAAATVDLSTVPNPALEAGDVVDIVLSNVDPAGSARRHVVDTVSIPLTPGDRFLLSTREIRSVEVAGE